MYVGGRRRSGLEASANTASLILIELKQNCDLGQNRSKKSLLKTYLKLTPIFALTDSTNFVLAECELLMGASS